MSFANTNLPLPGVIESSTIPACSGGRSLVAIDNDPEALRSLVSHLGSVGIGIQTANNATRGLELIDDTTAVVVVKLHMDGLSGFDVLRFVKKHCRWVQVIVLTEARNARDAVEAMREGAYQFFTRPTDPAKMVDTINRAMEASKRCRASMGMSASLASAATAKADPENTIQSKLHRQIDQIAALDATVFIGGETGTGKSTIAKLIHQKSRRRGGPFVAVNCASLPGDLIQSELFGHTKGAFTGAVSERCGHAEVADGGVLFLDEIGDLPLDLQPKLLTFLQDRTVQKLGSSRTRPVDVRLITATHRDLAEMCREGTFRQDLYFRLLVLSLELPALRLRTEEFESIANGILNSICRKQSIPDKTLTPGAIEMLKAHRWPGNFRELENVIERAIAFATGPAVTPRELLFSNVSLDRRSASRTGTPSLSGHADFCDSERQVVAPIRQEASHEPAQYPNSDTQPPENASLISEGYQLVGKTLEEIERDAILQTLEALGGNKAKTARTLGISEKSIYNKMRRLKITRPKNS